MISRLIEAKPEDLRVFLEEAAGISKYKERRRETENRIRHTRENLDRLNDLLEEIDKQLDKLKRQSRAAERYKELKEEERQVKAELLAQAGQYEEALDCCSPPALGKPPPPVLEARRAWVVAVITSASISKSGSPTARSIISRPPARSSWISEVKATVPDGTILLTLSVRYIELLKAYI